MSESLVYSFLLLSRTSRLLPTTTTLVLIFCSNFKSFAHHQILQLSASNSVFAPLLWLTIKLANSQPQMSLSSPLPSHTTIFNKLQSQFSTSPTLIAHPKLRPSASASIVHRALSASFSLIAQHKRQLSLASISIFLSTLPDTIEDSDLFSQPPSIFTFLSHRR